jgi:hypothetical protein
MKQLCPQRYDFDRVTKTYSDTSIAQLRNGAW